MMAAGSVPHRSTNTLSAWSPKKVLPQDASVVVEAEVSAVDLVVPIAVQVADGRNVRRVLRVAMPLAAIVPQHFELVVEREDIAA